jgi:hypothetical protein
VKLHLHSPIHLYVVIFTSSEHRDNITHKTRTSLGGQYQPLGGRYRPQLHDLRRMFVLSIAQGRDGWIHLYLNTEATEEESFPLIVKGKYIKLPVCAP